MGEAVAIRCKKKRAEERRRKGNSAELSLHHARVISDTDRLTLKSTERIDSENLPSTNSSRMYVTSIEHDQEKEEKKSEQVQGEEKSEKETTCQENGARFVQQARRVLGVLLIPVSFLCCVGD